MGRSSWSLDRPFVTLLPATMLMSLADSKQGKNRSGVRMFKDGKEREFPGGLVVKTLCSQRRKPRFDSLVRDLDPCCN